MNSFHIKVSAPAIDAAPAASPRPFWSVMVPAFVDRGFVRRTIASVLSDDPGPQRMQICVIDDLPGQTAVKQIVDEIGRGRVEFVQNATNVGVYEAWNVCIRHARGTWVHILHDDDVVFPGYYKAMEHGIARHPEVGAAFCRARNIDGQDRPLGDTPQELAAAGVFPDLPRRLAGGNAVLFPSMCVRRDVYETLGGFDPQIDFTADWEMWMRIACRYAVYYDPQPLVGYRRHGGSETSKLVRSGRDLRGLHVALRIFRDYLPDTLSSRSLLQATREHMALVGVTSARDLAGRGDVWAAMNQLREAIACAATPRVIGEIEAGALKPFEAFLQKLKQAVEHHAAGRADAQLAAALRGVQQSVIQQWTEFPAEEADSLLNGPLGQASQLLMDGRIRDEQLGQNQPLAEAKDVPTRLIVSLLQTRAWDLPAVELSELSPPLLGLYLRDALRPVSPGDDRARWQKYVTFLTELLGRLEQYQRTAAAPLCQELAAFVKQNVNLPLLQSGDAPIDELRQLVDAIARTA